MPMSLPARRRARTLLAAVALALPAAALGEPVRFAILGDLPYFAWEALRLEQMIEQMNAEPLAFVLHVGDIKGGQALCSDATYLERRTLFERSVHPFILLPGDNDWTDCHRASNGGYDPLERLALLRRTFHGGELSLGKRPLRPLRQPRHPENMRWELGEVVFVTVHAVGSDNGLGHSREGDAEFAERNAANLAWLDAAFDHATRSNARGMVVAFHANPRFDRPAGSRARLGHDDLVRALADHARVFAQPVLVVHGDTHTYRLDRPLAIHGAPDLDTVTRVESFGSPKVGWVRVTVAPDRPELFVVEPVP
jgi:hypothetical protein